jgi:catechol 2,3-dioxygenase-like lactoylglutathione lyase family enzyme
MKHAEIILYVADQRRSAEFYRAVLRQEPHLDVPGMTEFLLTEQCTLGLMPEDGIARLLGPSIPHPGQAGGVPRCELYLHVDDVRDTFEHAQRCGARVLDAPAERDWGHLVAYLADPDGHVLAFAQMPTTGEVREHT